MLEKIAMPYFRTVLGILITERYKLIANSFKS